MKIYSVIADKLKSLYRADMGKPEGPIRTNKKEDVEKQDKDEER